MTTTLTNRALPETIPSWGVLVIESHHSDQFTMDWRSHPFLKIVYVLSGRGQFHLGNETTDFRRGDVIVVPPKIRNRIVDDPTAASSLYVGCISTSLLRFDAAIVGRMQACKMDSDRQFADRVSALLRRLVHVQNRSLPTRSVAMVAGAMQLVQLVIEESDWESPTPPSGGSEHEVIRKYISSLDETFFEASTIDVAAASLGMSRRNFTKLFAAETGQTWLQYVRRLAIDYAKQCLRKTDLPITSVAFECGFHDLSTFYRQFKSQCGVSPAKYREGSNPYNAMPKARPK